MNHLARGALFLGITLGLASACGGKGKGAASPGGAGAFDQDAVKARLAATTLDDVQGCAADGAATIADVVAAQRAMLADSGPVDDSFTCRATGLAEGQQECTWEVIQRTTAEAAEDPCGGGGSAYQVIVQVNADGTLIPGQIACIAPG